MRKPTYKFACVGCGRNSQSTDHTAVMCRKCKAWAKPGKGQTSLLDALSTDATVYPQKAVDPKI